MPTANTNVHLSRIIRVLFIGTLIQFIELYLHAFEIQVQAHNMKFIYEGFCFIM